MQWVYSTSWNSFSGICPSCQLSATRSKLWSFVPEWWVRNFWMYFFFLICYSCAWMNPSCVHLFELKNINPALTQCPYMLISCHTQQYRVVLQSESVTTVWECFYYLELLVKWELLTDHYKTDFSPLKFLTHSPLQKGPPTKAFLLEVTSNTETSLPMYYLWQLQCFMQQKILLYSLHHRIVRKVPKLLISFIPHINSKVPLLDIKVLAIAVSLLDLINSKCWDDWPTGCFW